MVGRRRRRRDRSDSGHESFRNFARIAGPLLCIAGIALFVAGIASFNRDFERSRAEFDKRWNEFDRTPFGNLPNRPAASQQTSKRSDEGGNVWLFFLGVPLFGAGAFLTKAGYFGVAARYVAAESRPAVRTITQAVASGLRDEDDDDPDPRRAETNACPACGADNDADAKFCKSCGGAVAKACGKCGEPADPDAKFCDECGTPLHAQS